MNVIQYGFDSSESGVVSRYNVVSEEYSGKRLIFNTLTQNLAEVTHEEFDQLISGEDPTGSFRELGLLVSRDTNEVDLALELHRQLRQTEGVGLCLMVVPTLACNLRCRYCFNGIGHAKGDLTTAISDAISLARRELREGEPLRVTWYGGEPLLFYDAIHAASIELQQLCRDRRSEYTGEILTNGELLPKVSKSELFEDGIVHIQLSTDLPFSNSQRFVKKEVRGTSSVLH